MEKLPTEIKRRDFIYKQLIRKGRFAIYEKIMVHVPQPMPGEPSENVTIGYEVIVIRKQKTKQIYGEDYPAKELYPSSASWGKNGFTFYYLQDAKKKLDYLISMSDGRKRRIAS